MASAVTYSDGTIRQNFSGEVMEVYWESPSTMDSADTVAVPTITGKSVRIISAWDHTTGDACTATVSTSTITIDAGGSTTDHTYGIKFQYV